MLDTIDAGFENYPVSLASSNPVSFKIRRISFNFVKHPKSTKYDQ